jgi:hypothetical protein
MSQLQVTGEAKIRDIQGPVVANSGVITALDGAANQYVRGDGTLAIFPSSSGGGSSVSYYLNGSVNQGTFGGSTYYQMSRNAIVGTGTNFSTSANGLIAQFITDANDPDVVSIPSGNWNLEFFMSVSASSGSLASFYVEFYKYNGSTFTLLATNVATPEFLTNTTTVDAYFTSVAMPLSAMAVTDRLAVRIFANVASKTVTLYTEDNRLCQIVTTFSNGLTSLNNLTDQSQYLAVGTSGTDFNIASSGDTHTFNIPSASLTNRGLVTTGSQTFAGAKTFENNLNINGQLFVFGATGYGGGVSYRQGNILATSDGSTTLEFPDESSIKYYVGQGSNTYKNFIFDVANITIGATRTYNLPDLSGTLALTSDLSSYVPYTGATGDVDLGVHSLTAFGVTANSFYAQGNGTQGGYLYLKQGTIPYGTLAGSNSISADGTKYIYLSDAGSNNSKTAIFQLGSITNNTERTYTLPDLSGTLALLEGTQTFTGAKTFGSSVSINTGGQASLSILSSSGNSALILGYVNSVLRGTIDISATEFKLISAIDNILKFQSSTNFRASLIFSNSADYSYTFPNATGTLALTSNLSAYLPLTGGTLTGALSGTSATFSGAVQGDFLVVGTTAATSGGLRLGTQVAIRARNVANTANIPLIESTASDGVSVSNGALILASTGAATFSSSVTAQNDGAFYRLKRTSGTDLGYITDSTTWGASGTDFAIGASSANMVFYTNNSVAERMRITSGGNVGIGTSNPIRLLSLGSSFGPSGGLSTNIKLAVYDNGTSGDTYGLGISGGMFEIQSAENIGFYTGAGTTRTERMRIASNGNVGIGQTPNADCRFNVRGVDSSGSNIALYVSNSSVQNLFYVRNDGLIMTGTAGASPYNNTTAVAANVQVDANGFLARSTSSLKYKTDVSNYDKGLDIVNQLRPVYYKGINDGNKVFAGLIAEEVHELGLTEFVQYAEDGSPDALAYQNMVALLVKAVQELTQKVNELESKIK